MLVIVDSYLRLFYTIKHPGTSIKWADDSWKNATSFVKLEFTKHGIFESYHGMFACAILCYLCASIVTSHASNSHKMAVVIV